MKQFLGGHRVVGIHQPLLRDAEQQRLVESAQCVRPARLDARVTEQFDQSVAGIGGRRHQVLSQFRQGVQVPEQFELQHPQPTVGGERLDDTGPDGFEPFRRTHAWFDLLPGGRREVVAPALHLPVQGGVEQRLLGAEVIADRREAHPGGRRDVPGRRPRVSLVVQAARGAVDQVFAISHDLTLKSLRRMCRTLVPALADGSATKRVPRTRQDISRV
ncbi:hypothetical protein AXA44_20530 [Rhodococcus sp. SC4]|nr:hypothetical protein AXA44_20530 [Rhodococcus sp. SC4]